MAKSIIQSVKGTRDFYPEDMAVRTYLLEKIRKVSEAYGYQEYDGPFLERLELYAAKSGEELVREQSYVFNDRGGDEITLRPELTPSLARMVAQRQKELAYPLRWWSFGPFWRYERPQKGRTREFFQWNIDLIGANGAEADAELMAICASFFQEVGLGADKVRIAINSRKLIENELADLGVASQLREAVFRVIDRQDKLPPKEWEEYALGAGLTGEQFSGLRALLASPNLWEKSEDLQKAIAVLNAMGLGDYIEFDASIIRGLTYYTNLVFEAQDRDGGRSILGGGHYDNLVNDVGGDMLPAVGFAMGDVMMALTLKKYDLLPEMKRVPADFLVTVFDDSALVEAFALSAQLRLAGFKVVVFPEAAKLQKQLKFADRIGARFVLIAGPDERAAGQVTVKSLVDRSQVTVARAQLVESLRELLAQAAPV